MKRTVKGNMIDMQKLAFENKNTVAVGNMNVNANGDYIDKQGNIITKKEDVAKFYYKTEKSTTKVESLKEDITKEVTKIEDSVNTDVVEVKESKSKKTKVIEEVQDNGDIIIKDKQ